MVNWVLSEMKAPAKLIFKVVLTLTIEFRVSTYRKKLRIKEKVISINYSCHNKQPNYKLKETSTIQML